MSGPFGTCERKAFSSGGVIERGHHSQSGRGKGEGGAGQMPRSPVLSPTNDQRLMGFLYQGEQRSSSWQVSLCARHPSHASGGGVIPGSCQTL